MVDNEGCRVNVPPSDFSHIAYTNNFPARVDRDVSHRFDVIKRSSGRTYTRGPGRLDKASRGDVIL